MEEQQIQILISIGVSVLASFIFKIIELLVIFANKTYRKKKGDFFFSFRAIDTHLILTGLALTLSLLLVYCQMVSQLSAMTVIFLLATNSLWTMSKRMGKLEKSGIIGIDDEIEKGLDYKSALNLVRSDFMFLGTGGHKLTQCLDEFEGAITSASQNRTVKFLLCHPDSAALVVMAKQAKKDVDQYKYNVMSSLRVINSHIEMGRNIEVRFYKADIVDEMPIFRLMFFNRNYCLCSYNIFGEDERQGEKTPQLHLYDHHNKDGTGSFHIAFYRYFDRLWEQSDKYNIKQILSSESA